MLTLVNFLSDLLWGSVIIYLLVGGGIYFTFRLAFVQISGLSKALYLLKRSRCADKKQISSFQALCTSLGARISTGNLLGVVVAITFGGPGALFWMWVIAFLGMATTFAECTLAQLYKRKDTDSKAGIYRGGPAYYIEQGLGFRWLGCIYSFVVMVTLGFVFNAIQSEAIAYVGYSVFEIDPLHMGIGLTFLCAFAIFGGFKRVARICALLVPVMVVFYLGICLFLIIKHAAMLPDVFALVFNHAFGFDAAASGLVGFSISQSMVQGIKAGMFSNEAGMGSSPNAAASAEPAIAHPAAQGFLHMLGIFLDTFVVCTASGLVFLLSGEYTPLSEIAPIQLVFASFNALLGESSQYLVAITVLFFSFTSIMANYAYAETNFLFLLKQRTSYLILLRFSFLFMVLVGGELHLPLIWIIANVSMGVGAIINMLAILLLSGTVFTLMKDFNHQWLKNTQAEVDMQGSKTRQPETKNIVFSHRRYAELHSGIYEGSWGKPLSDEQDQENREGIKAC